MKGITRQYLLYVISDCIKITIRYRRQIPNDELVPDAIEITEEEIIDFIASIPYFDTELKDFLMGNLTMQTIIISETWEKDFVQKGITWSTNPKWTEADMSFLPNSYKNVVITNFLSMPY